MEGLCPCADQEGVEERVEFKHLVGVPFAREVGEEGVLPAAPATPQSFHVHHLRPPRGSRIAFQAEEHFLAELSSGCVAQGVLEHC